MYVNDIWNKSYMNCGNEMLMKKWSSQWTQFMQLRKEAWKKCRTSTGFEPVTSRLPVRCSTNWAMKPLTMGAGQLWVHMWVDMFNCGNIWTHNWTYMFNFHFISAVHIGFISYVINTHFFHGNIRTHNWPAPNVSGFIVQFVEHCTGNREVTGSNPIEVLNCFQASLRNCINCVHCDDHFFIFISFPQVIYDLFHISLETSLLHVFWRKYGTCYRSLFDTMNQVC